MEVVYEPPVFVKAVTSDNVCTLRLTSLDQIFKYYRTLIVAYNRNGVQAEENKAADAAGVLRKGLEEVVAHYPWAAGGIRAASEGRLLEVGFNEGGGPGAQFVSARANCLLADLGNLAEPNPAFAPLFAAVDMTAPLHSRPLVALQVTTFEDGGVCVSTSFHHALFDGVGFSIFMQNVCSSGRGEGVRLQMDTTPRELRIKPSVINPQNVQQQLQQKKYHGLRLALGKDLTAQQKVQTMRINFSNESLAHLRLLALSTQHDCCGKGLNACSRFEALAAHLWKAKAEAKFLICESASEDLFPLRIVVNARGRAVGSNNSCIIPLNYMGNAECRAIAWATVEELTTRSLAFAVEKIQEAIGGITVERFQAEVDYVEMMGGGSGLSPEVGYLSITSVAGLGLWAKDFGWGKPAYFGHPCVQRPSVFIISEDNPQNHSLNVLTALDSRLQKALQLCPASAPLCT